MRDLDDRSESVLREARALARGARRERDDGDACSSAAGYARSGRGARVPRRRRCPATTRSCSATWRGAVERSARRSPPASGSASTATTTSTGSARPRSPSLTLRELGADVDWHLPSRFEEGYGVSRETLARLADEGVRARAHRRLRDHRRRGGRASATRSALDVVVTDHHRPGETLPDCPVVATRPVRLPVPRALRHRRRLQARARRCSAPGHPALARHLDLVALATIADVVPLVDENRALARRRPAGARPDAEARPAGADARPRASIRRRVDDGAVGFRLAPRINAAGRLGRPDVGARAAAHRGRRRGRPARRRARGAEPRAAGRRGADPPRGGRDGRGVAGGRRSAAAATSSGRRGLARGRDRHRRLAARRALPPPGRADRGHGRRVEGLGPLDPGASTSTAASPPAPTHLERFGGHRAAAGLSIRPETVERVRRGLRRPRRRRARRRTTCGRVTRRRRGRPGAGADARARAASSRRLAPFGLGNPGVTLLVAGCEPVDAATVGDGKHLRFRVRERERDAGSAIAFGLGTQLDRFRREGALRRRLPPRRRTAGTARSRRSSSSGASSTRPRATRTCASGSRRSVARGGRAPGHPRRRRSSPSSASPATRGQEAAARVGGVPGAARRAGRSCVAA